MIIIDEMSMVSADVLYKIHKRLCDIFINNLPFGGISTMWVGDLLQLKPVRGRFIFEEPRDPGKHLKLLEPYLLKYCQQKMFYEVRKS